MKIIIAFEERLNEKTGVYRWTGFVDRKVVFPNETEFQIMTSKYLETHLYLPNKFVLLCKLEDRGRYCIAYSLEQYKYQIPDSGILKIKNACDCRLCRGEAFTDECVPDGYVWISTGARKPDVYIYNPEIYTSYWLTARDTNEWDRKKEENNGELKYYEGEEIIYESIASVHGCDKILCGQSIIITKV